jgi:hypothetical protein
VALGCFEDELVELLQGMLVELSPQGPRPAAFPDIRIAVDAKRGAP